MRVVLFCLADILGVIWKRLKWPWTALRIHHDPSTKSTKNLTQNVQSSESYLKEKFPAAQIPQSLLKSHLRESLGISEGSFDFAQGELLGLGVTRHTRARTESQISEQSKRFCLAFPSGELGTNVSMVLMYSS
jgi:hypothetical protein